MKASLAYVAVVVCLVGAAWLVLKPAAQRPEPLARAAAAPQQAEQIAGTWYWLEQPPRARARLMRAWNGSAAEVASADQIAGYHGDGKHIAFTALNGREWSVGAAGPDGQGRTVLWAGPQRAGAPRIVGDRVYWTVSGDPPVRDGGPLPPLGRTLRVMSSPVAVSAPVPLCALMEPGVGYPLGASGGLLYVAASRDIEPPRTVIYRVPLAGGAPKRVVGEAGTSTALLSADGRIYCTAPSPESSNPSADLCVLRMGADGRAQLLMDWLPAPGHLYDTPRGICYVGGYYPSGAYPIGERREWPRSVSLPEGYVPAAAGSDGLLLSRPVGTSSAAELSQIHW